MIPDVVAALRCPLCRGPLAEGERGLRCASGHAFDAARHGYVSFLVGRPSGLVGDDADMVAARVRVLEAGHFDPLAAALAAVASADGAGEGLVVDVGAGTGWYLARALDASPGAAGLAVDLSKFAARRAARAHPRAAAAVADARAPLPLADGCARLVLDVFAPRNGPELRRILRDDGLLVVVTPAPEHLAELRGVLGLLEVDPEKERRVADALGPWFERASSTPIRWTMHLSRADVLALAKMGPSARHVGAEALAARAAGLPEPAAVTASVVVERWRPR
ncbi:MAG TPA: 23S rRNA methyltransferase [Anaeromyxobacteraceae bacterium]|nr:23S rRNA methyltransferase [Anaeromyxobacteraceae bacterium]